MFEYYIGEEYSQKEFDLEYVKTVVVKGISNDLYKYIGSDRLGMSLEVEAVILVYNCDFLKSVFFVLKSTKEFG